MADYQDVIHADSERYDARTALETYLGQLEDSDRAANVALTLGLAALSLGATIEAMSTRIDYLAHNVIPYRAGGHAG